MKSFTWNGFLKYFYLNGQHQGQLSYTPEAKVFDAFGAVFDKKEMIKTLISMYLKGYHLSKNPRKRISEEVMSTRAHI